jgi:hypothetical protein
MLIYNTYPIQYRTNHNNNNKKKGQRKSAPYGLINLIRLPIPFNNLCNPLDKTISRPQNWKKTKKRGIYDL